MKLKKLTITFIILSLLNIFTQSAQNLINNNNYKSYIIKNPKKAAKIYNFFFINIVSNNYPNINLNENNLDEIYEKILKFEKIAQQLFLIQSLNTKNSNIKINLNLLINIVFNTPNADILIEDIEKSFNNFFLNFK